ncbi:uncharacterized protein LOC123556625 [Mercenaria mercenaria]|uniref:uncharacterized protein LOC123556625 n=1 Tax=Mercenaria mercenaria TaxID=6596 RepID=UPI001E1DF2C4|nr:uncharacterized protein LOC123556625 [Mercenaria mercenaria]XP_045203442.1 uncharacterized protein LOC123556625 [Mercenaria mercenaria]XP_045203443.1 uncharacterized protein LOC123556625 [Mercenaria mercenaria]XP_045203444.1 uncharacterized protein LOC123556625 [Mercenaria mercenaria]
MGKQRKTNKRRTAEKPEIRIKGTAKTDKKTPKQNNSTTSVNSLEKIKKKGNNENRASYVAGTVGGIVGGTIAGALIWPVGLVLGGPVGGIIIGAGAAGLSGVAIQDILSMHDQLLRFLVICLGVLIIPVLFYLVFLTATFEYVQEELAPRGFIHLE